VKVAARMSHGLDKNFSHFDAPAESWEVPYYELAEQRHWLA